METLNELSDVANDIFSTCLSFPALSIPDINKRNESIIENYQQKMTSLSLLASLNIEIKKQRIVKEINDDEKELRTNEELSKELRQLMINTQIQRLKYLRGVQDDIICPILTGNVTKDNEQSILDLVRRRDRLVVKLQSFISEYQQIQQENCELRQKNIELQQSCDDMVHTLTEQSTIIQELEENVDESTKEKERTELLQAKKENRSQKKRNDILRNIYSSLVLVSKLDWSKKERIRELMLCNEDAPGVPEKDLD